MVGVMEEQVLEFLRTRFAQLSEEDKNIIRSLAGTPEGQVLAKMFGPVIMKEIVFRKPTGQTRRRGLGTR
jgi:hypothetical protein|tara:strand:+ start:588 stop:797 length:210 start_codon:yes stop_codon:yes gene_type:complete